MSWLKNAKRPQPVPSPTIAIAPAAAVVVTRPGYYGLRIDRGAARSNLLPPIIKEQVQLKLQQQ